jgi:rhodanese-related sulfurtransferase/DNA-binding transcriptional ArsR family regulator
MIKFNKSIESLNIITKESTLKNESRKLKEHLYELFAQIGSALANPHRLELLDLLIQSPHTVEELAKLAQMSVANTSQHLQRLKQARLVLDERIGQNIRYCLSDPEVAALFIELRRVSEQQLAEVDQVLDRFRSHRYDFEPISVEEVRKGIDRDEIVLIDARPKDEYLAGHLPDAVSLPIDILTNRIDELPLGKLMVAYCRGPYCADADEALILLSAYGYPVKRLEEGIAEWRQAGLRLEKVDIEA